MKIFIDCMTLQRGAGVGTYIENIVSNIPRQYDIIAVTGKYHEFKRPVTQVNPIFYNNLTRLVYEHLIFPIIACLTGSDIMFIPKSYAPLLRILPVVSTMHDILPVTESRESIASFIYWKLSFASAAYLSTGIIMITDIINNEFKEEYRPAAGKKTAIIHNGWDKFNKLSQSSEQYIVIPATMKKRKNIPLACRTAMSIREEFPDKTVIVTGRIDDLSIKRSLEEDFPGIEIMGYIEHSELEEIMNNAFLVIYLSCAEGYGLPIGEALSLNKRVLAYDTALNRYLYSNGPLYYNPSDTFNDNIQRILKEIKDGKEKKVKARQWERAGRQTAEFLDKIHRK
ncbi:MAG: glycosyltransferase [bacterium]